MKAAIIVFPGSNCDRDVAVSLEKSMGTKPLMLWHRASEVPKDLDLIILPGGFSYGDYLRCGAMAAHSPVMAPVKTLASKGTRILGICNGFQILVEMGLLPGTLMRNRGLTFVCKDVFLRVERTDTDFARGYVQGQPIQIPISHHDGNYFADDAALEKIEDRGQVAFRYCDASAAVTAASNPNGSRNNIAGLYNESATVLGIMPHPERLADPQLGGSDGRSLFDSLVEALSQ